jgi:hypothetical protein
VNWTTGDLADAVAMARQAQDLADEVGDPALQVAVRVGLGTMLHALGQHQRSVDVLEEAARQIDRTSGRILVTRPPAVTVRVWLAFVLSDLGRLREARTRIDEAMTIAESLGRPNTLMAACGCAGYLHAWFGDPARALAW